MKKLSLLMVAATAAMAANAQYTCDPEMSTTLTNHSDASIFDVFVLDEASLSSISDKTVNDLRVNDETRFLYIWEGTFTGGDGSYPGVGMHVDGYLSLDVTSVGWSGAGFFGPADFKHLNENSRFHVALRTAGTAPSSVAFILTDGKTVDGSVTSPICKFAVGDAFVDGGSTYATIAPQITDEWSGLDISFKDLKKFYPSFDPSQYASLSDFSGNFVSFLGGGVTGQNISLDALYFYTPSDSNAVKSVLTDSVDFVVTRNTINVSGAESISLYDLSGKLVKKSNSSVLGLTYLAKGIYVAKAGNTVRKVVIK